MITLNYQVRVNLLESLLPNFMKSQVNSTVVACPQSSRILVFTINILSLSQHLSLPSVFIGARVAESLVFCALFCMSLFFWPLCCLSFLILRFLSTYLVSSDFKLLLIDYVDVANIRQSFSVKFLSDLYMYQEILF